MKKTMKAMKMCVALLMAGLTLGACSSDDNEFSSQPVEPGVPHTQTFTMIVNASKGGDATTRGTLTDNGTTITPAWGKNDEVSVFNVTKNAKITGTLKAEADGINTTLKGDLIGTIEANDQLRLTYMSANYDSQDGTLTGIAANCDYAIATVSVTAVSSGIITTSDATFISQQAIVRFTLKNSDGTSSLSATKLTVNANGSTYTITSALAASVMHVAIPGFSSKTVTLTANVGGKDYACVKNGVTLANGSYYRINAKLWDRIALSAATTDHLGFVVGADGYVYPTKAAAVAAGTTASGIIAYVGSAGSADASSSTYKGLAIGLENAGGSDTRYKWSDTKGHQCVSQTYNDGGSSISYMDGIACTEMLVTSNGNYHAGCVCVGYDHAAAKAAHNFSTSRPAGVSAWFLPSMGQWNLIVKGLATKKKGHTVNNDLTNYDNDTYRAASLNSVITDAGGTALDEARYWSATEKDNWYICDINFYWGHSRETDRTDANCCVRPVFAF